MAYVLAIIEWMDHYRAIFENFSLHQGKFNFERKLKSMERIKCSLVDWIQIHLPDSLLERAREFHKEVGKYAPGLTGSPQAFISKWFQSHNVDYGLILFSLLIGLLVFSLAARIIKMFGSVIRFLLKVVCVLLISFLVHYSLSEGGFLVSK